MGLIGKNTNDEVSLLIQTEKKDLLKELGIKLNHNHRRLISTFKILERSSIYETIIKNNKFYLNLLAAERSYGELVLFVSGEYSKSLNILIFDKQNKIIYSQNILAVNREIRIKIESDTASFQYVQLSDEDGNAISNKILVSDYLIIAKTHPNPNTEEIERLYGEIQNGDLSRILDLLTYAINDDVEGNIFLSSPNNEPHRPARKEPDQIYDLSTYKYQEHTFFEKNLLIFSTSLRVLDTLRLLNYQKSFLYEQRDFKLGEQEGNIDDMNVAEANESINTILSSYSELRAERRKLYNYFNAINDYQQDRVFGDRRTKEYKLTLSDLARYLIATELMFQYGGRISKYFDKKNECVFHYLPFSKDYLDDNLKDCCLNIVGGFLMLAKNGFEQYNFEYTRKKVEIFRHESLVSTIVCILNNNWERNEQHYFYTMCLNTLHYLGWRDSFDFEKNYPDLSQDVTEKISNLKFRAKKLDENWLIFQSRICFMFLAINKRRESKAFNTGAVKGQILYSSLVGYCYIKDIPKANEFILIRPGFLWDEDKFDFVRHQPNDEYRPLPIKNYITINIF